LRVPYGAAMQMHGAPSIRIPRAHAVAVTAIAALFAACGSPGAPTPSSATATTSAPASGDIVASPGTTSLPMPESSRAAVPTGATSTGGRFPGGLLIADRGNGRLLVVDSTGKPLWRFPTSGSLPPGQGFAADDAFIAPDGKSIVANDEGHQVIDRIDIATRRVVWQYGHYGMPGRGAGYLNTPDDAYPLANGDVIVADIRNCRVIEIAPSKQIVRQWGRTGVCIPSAPNVYGSPNGDTPLPDGGLLITEIRGSRVVRLSAAGKVIFDINVPVRYPSDAHLDAQGNVIVADYSTVGAVVAVTPRGHLLWRYAPASGDGRLDHPSLAVPLPDGTVVVNDDFRARVVVIDPKTMRIVWQYGRTGLPGRGPNQLSDPDGVDPLPASGL
jgi:outer membrane protein assembly factor BamB